MILDCLTPNSPKGVFYDDGTGKRITYVRWADTETGEYVALEPEPDGEASGRQYRARAVGRLKFVPLAGARVIKRKQTEEDRALGLEQYRKLFYDMWRFREEAKKHVAQRWYRRMHG